MHEAVYQFANEASWRLRTLVRTSRFYKTSTLVRLFKCHILSFVEGATPAIYHAAPAILKQLDDVFDVFLEPVGVSIVPSGGHLEGFTHKVYAHNS
jgi:hypothetical protein